MERINFYYRKQIENWVKKLYGYDVRPITSYVWDRNPPTFLEKTQPWNTMKVEHTSYMVTFTSEQNVTLSYYICI